MTSGLLLLIAALSSPVCAEASFPEMRTDPRFELLAMVELLSDADRRNSGFQRHDIAYQRKAVAHFAPFAKHPVVGRFKELADAGFDYLQAYQFVFALSDPPELALREQLPEPLIERVGGAGRAEEFRLLLVDFSKASGFPAFYAKSAPELGALLAAVRAQAAKVDCRAKLESYTGAPVKARYDFIISPFAQPVLVATYNRVDSDGTPRITSLYGPDEYEGKFGFRFATRSGSIWREVMGQRMLAAAEPYRARLAKSESLYAPVGPGCASSWYDCAQRNISFAVGARMLYLYGDREMGLEWPIKYARIGLPYIAPLIETLKEYEAHRDRYPTLESFYPRLVETFEALSAGELKALVYSGTISTILADAGPVVVVAPPASSLPAATAARLETLVKKRWPTAARMTGERALSEPLGGKILIVIGTLADNPWLAKHYEDLKLPVRFEGGQVMLTRVVGELKTYAYGGRAGLITTGLNPSDAAKPVLVYAAVDEETLAGVLDAYDGPADYVIYDGSELRKVGLYEKSRVPWRIK